jgi:hypothetical protein
MMGEHHSSFGITDPAYGATPAAGSPWDSSAGGDLGRQAGVGDIGHEQHAVSDTGSGTSDFDNSADTDTADDQADQDVSDVDDSGSDFGGDGDYSDT